MNGHEELEGARGRMLLHQGPKPSKNSWCGLEGKGAMWQEQGEPGGSSLAAGRRGRPTRSRRAGRRFGVYSKGSGESWKPERTQSDPSGCRREGAREAASPLGFGGPGRVRAPWAQAHSRAGFQLPSLPTLSRAPLCSGRLPNSDQRPGNLG